MNNNRENNILLFVTGASRGLGRAIAEAFCAENHWDRIHFVLVARSLDGLEATRRALLKVRKDDSLIHLVQLDCSDLDTLEQRLDDTLGELARMPTIHDFDRIICINNHGTLGHIGPCVDCPSFRDMRKTIDINVTSSFWISLRIARFAKEARTACTVVNISSLVALQVFPSLGLYSAGKAARDSFHKAMSIEEGGENVRVLNYAPGPLETDMTEEIRSASLLHESLKPHYQKQLVDPADSSRTLVQLVVENVFENGSHIDYYDIAGPPAT
jgi:sepiapterin reductase